MKFFKLILIIFLVIIAVLVFLTLAGCDETSAMRVDSVDQEVRLQKNTLNDALREFVTQRDIITRGYVKNLREKIMLDSLINQASREGRDTEVLMQKRLDNKEELIKLNIQDAEYKSHIDILHQEMLDWDRRHPGWWK